MMLRRVVTVAGLAVAAGLVVATPASADPLVAGPCRPGDDHVQVQVFNTEVAEVCY